jgi:ADP-heptose:LPS heptosyltransferase
MPVQNLKQITKFHPPSPNPSREGRGISERILVIRFGALGDLMMCRQAFHEIREAHKDAEIALLTTPPFEKFARSMPWFDSVIAAERAPFWQVHQWLALMVRLYPFAPKRVYDLQGKFRQSIIFWLLGGSAWGPEWSGAARGCSHPRLWPPAPDMHFVGFLAAQLRRADVPEAGIADMSWLNAPLDGLHVPEKFALLIPGCSPKLIHKRWPAEKYAELAQRLKERGIASVAIGTGAEADTISALRRAAPDVVDLSGKTDLYQLAALARRAVCAIGNDTGPMHLAAAVGCPTLAILSGHTDPVWSAPYGAQTAWVKQEPIDGVSVDEVFLALTALLDRKN